MIGVHFKGEAEVTEEIPNKRYVFTTKGGIKSNWVWTLEEEDGGTRLQLVVEYAVPMPVLGRMAERVVIRLNHGEAKLAMYKLKENIEWVTQFKVLQYVGYQA